MIRRLLLASLPVAMLIASACTSPRVIVATPEPLDSTPAPVIAAELEGFAAIGQPTLQYIFAPREVVVGEIPAPPTLVRDASMQLKALVDGHARLKITPLPSTDGTVALGFQETSTVKDHWGGVMIPAERKLFARFASDITLGKWLIVVDDVHVTDGKDPVPLTAYRWPRSAVEAYFACGIPPQFVIDDCTHSFYGASEIVFLFKPGIDAGQ
jgi:hypothetical protein